MPTALITGASRGLGLALADALADRGWRLVLDARGVETLADVADDLGRRTRVDALPGDVSDATHRGALADAVAAAGSLDLLVNNASALGPSPLPRLADLDDTAFMDLLRINVAAPIALFRQVRPWLATGAVVVDVTSDAGVEAWPGWGPYGASKAALDQLSAVLAVEHPDLHVYAFDPGDMRTAMHQDAFPDEDIADRPEPTTVVPALLHLVDRRPASGRVRATDLLAEVAA